MAAAGTLIPVPTAMRSIRSLPSEPASRDPETVSAVSHRLYRRFVSLMLALSLLGVAAPAWAWGDLGHKIICQIAFQELNEKARKKSSG